MTRATNQKGRTFENECVQFFRRWFPKAERRSKRGKRDAGDIAGTPFTVQCKRQETLRLEEWLGCLEEQRRHNDNDSGLLATRRNGKRRVWHMTDETLASLLDAIHGRPE